MYAQEKIKPYEGNAHKREQVEQLFDNIAPTYDTLNHTLSFGFDRAWRRKAVRTLMAYNPATVLDIATGTGDFALAIARKLKLRHVMAVDISEGMMRVGREKAAREGLHDVVRFQKEDCSHLSFADNSFDAEPLQASLNAGLGVGYKLNDSLQLFAETTLSHHFDNSSHSRTLYNERATNLNLACGVRMKL